MNSLQELVAYLDHYLECSRFRDFCHNGLQVEGKEQVRRIATAVTATSVSIQAAIDWGADVLLVHHGLFWEKGPLQVRGPLRHKLTLLLEHGVSLLAYHLPLDAHPAVGNNWVAARELGLQDLQPFGEYNGMFIGVSGVIPGGLKVNEWVPRVESYYQQAGRTALFGPDPIQSVGIISGGAHREFVQAVEKGLDCYITGTGDEPNQNMAAEERRHFMALGHAATERIGVRALADLLRSHGGFETAFLRDDNPF